MSSLTVATPLGPVALTEDDGALVRVAFAAGGQERSALLDEASRQLEAYFAGDLRSFDLPLRPGVDAFGQSVLDAMRAIPYGETREYGQIARDLDTMPQPVGQACGQNPIPIVIPCHRVVGASGLGGFSAPGGVETKVALLRHEGAYSLLL